MSSHSQENLDSEIESETCQRVYCANCLNCKITAVKCNDDPHGFLLRVRCAKHMWKKRLGEPKLQKFFTVARRTMEDCSHYEEMGDGTDFLHELRDTLPIKDEVYIRSSSGLTISSR